MSVRPAPSRPRATRRTPEIQTADLAALIAALSDDLAPGSLRLEALFDRIEVRP